jgi:hypothetical protein
MTGACSSEAALIFDASVTVTVKAYEDDPFGGTVAGDTAHVVELGPPQLSETAPLKPPIGDTCRLYVAACPELIVAEVEQFPPAGQFGPLAGARTKSIAAPARATDCRPPMALSLIVAAPER